MTVDTPFEFPNRETASNYAKAVSIVLRGPIFVVTAREKKLPHLVVNQPGWGEKVLESWDGGRGYDFTQERTLP